MLNDNQLRNVKEIYSIRKNSPDNLFITCGSFEERFLGVPKRIKERIFNKLIMFKFTERNPRREELINQMEKILRVKKIKNNYRKIFVEHGKDLEGILKFHALVKENNLNSKNLYITVDITTFTKNLLLNLILYLFNFLSIKKLRLLYTIPRRYASPQEGWLSFGIKSIHIPPMCWNEWSPLKDNLLIIILGFEEMRAWSLIDYFSADLNWVFITNPGSKPEWNLYCKKYNKRLLDAIESKGEVPALDPFGVSNILSNYITLDIIKKYNIFISPLGTKPQLIGILHFMMIHLDIPINIITTTVEEHNIPYYSWDIGETFEFFFTNK